MPKSVLELIYVHLDNLPHQLNSLELHPNSLIVSITKIRWSKKDPTATLRRRASGAVKTLQMTSKKNICTIKKYV